MELDESIYEKEDKEEVWGRILDVSVWREDVIGHKEKRWQIELEVRGQ